jgi:hypothetical protein
MTDPRALGHRHADERAAGEARGAGAYDPALAHAHEADLQAAVAELDAPARAAFLQAYMHGTMDADRERAVLADLETLPPDPGPVQVSPWTPLAKLQARSRYLDACARGQAMFDALDPARVGNAALPLVSGDLVAIHEEKIRIDHEIERRQGKRMDRVVVLVLLGLAAVFVAVVVSRS